MQNSPLKSKSSNYTPKGIPGLNLGRKDSSETQPSKRGGVSVRSEFVGGPGTYPRLAKKGDDKSSGQSNPINKGDDNKKRYTPVPQPSAYSNDGPRPTKFIN